MDITSIGELISTTGFPIACVLLLAYYIRELTNNHKEEVTALTSELQKMCLSVQSLADKIEELLRKEDGTE